MTVLVKILGVFIIIAGLWILMKPSMILDWLELNMGQKSMYITAIIFRLVLGSVLYIVAPQSKFPRLLKIFGILSILAAITFIFIGHQNFVAIMTSIIPKIKSFAPVSGLISVAVGMFFLVAFSKEKSKHTK